MFTSRTIKFCLIFLLFPVSALAGQTNLDAENTCDYYDQYANFFLNFDKNIKLGPSGPSNVSGISFIFEDESKLYLMPGLEGYDPLAKYGEEDSIPDDLLFIHEYDKEGCSLAYVSRIKATVISCDTYEYSIFPSSNDSNKMYTIIKYDFKSNDSRAEYEKILHSIKVMPPSLQSEYYEISRNAIGNYYFSQDENYRDRVDIYEQAVDIACGRYRVYNKLKQKIEQNHTR